MANFVSRHGIFDQRRHVNTRFWTAFSLESEKDTSYIIYDRARYSLGFEHGWPLNVHRSEDNEGIS